MSGTFTGFLNRVIFTEPDGVDFDFWTRPVAIVTFGGNDTLDFLQGAGNVFTGARG